jgi:hypothetical protein
VERTLATALLLGWVAFLREGHPASFLGGLMKIKFTASCVGSDFSFAAHSTHELDDEFAGGFIRAGLAVRVEPVIEVATLPAPERVATIPDSKKPQRR